ncbi:MAG: hypothetical protein HRT68_01165 [Flavobacteriaceae bacterium]|nr:hypothetical protein [Flavobacteriaceae bacterium]
MQSRTFRKYYLDVNLSNLVFALVLGNLFGFLWGVIAFCTVGALIGYMSFHFLKKNEYYLYYNLGFTKSSLLKRVLVINLILALIPIIILILTT